MSRRVHRYGATLLCDYKIATQDMDARGCACEYHTGSLPSVARKQARLNADWGRLPLKMLPDWQELLLGSDGGAMLDLCPEYTALARAYYATISADRQEQRRLAREARKRQRAQDLADERTTRKRMRDVARDQRREERAKAKLTERMAKSLAKGTDRMVSRIQ